RQAQPARDSKAATSVSGVRAGDPLSAARAPIGTAGCTILASRARRRLGPRVSPRNANLARGPAARRTKARMNRFALTSLCLLGSFLPPRVAHATKSAELYTGTSYPYGRFEARMRVAAGDGVVSAFFLWKDKSEQTGVFWNELDYEKIGASCEL